MKVHVSRTESKRNPDYRPYIQLALSDPIHSSLIGVPDHTRGVIRDPA